jgi:methylthioribulose-1-phosphate dehydratase
MIDFDAVFAAYEALHAIKHTFGTRGWFPGTSGNVSMRLSSDPPTMMISTSGKDKTVRTASDFLIVRDGMPIGTTHTPSAETAIHEAIYACTDSNAVAHIHTAATTMVSLYDAPHGCTTFAAYEMIKALGIWDPHACVRLPITPNDADVRAIAHRLPSVIDDRVPGILLRGHGLYAWGKTIDACKRHVEALESLCTYRLTELRLGGNSLTDPVV